MYEIFEQLLQKYGVTTYQVSKATGISQSTFSNWKSRRNLLSADKATLIANYFGVSLDYLMTGKEESKEKAPELTARDERDIEKKLTETLAQLESGDGLMFNGEVLDEETKRLLEISLRSTLESAKIAAKKFTPNKYKK